MTNLCCAVLRCSVMSDSLQPHGLYPARLLCPWESSRQEYWSGLPFPPPGDLPNPGIKSRSPALQVDSLPSEPTGKPNNPGVGSLSLLPGIFLTQESNWASCVSGRFFISWATREAHDKPRQHIRKQRHHFTNKDLCNQSYGFSSSHLCMWELDHKEGWVLKNWCFWIVVLEKTLESPFGLQRDQTSQFWRKSTVNIHWKVWCWSCNTWLLDAKSWLIENDPDAVKNWRQKEKDVVRMR